MRSPFLLRCAAVLALLTVQKWKERGYLMNDEVRAKTLPAWKEWFNANIVAK